MSDSTTIRVILVDDHPVVRFGLAAIIGLQPDMAMVAEAGSGEEACALCARQPATEGGGLLRYQHGSFRIFGAAEGLTNGFVRVIFEDSHQNLWVGTDRGLFRLQQETLTRVDNRDGIPQISVNTICEDRAGRLLVGGSGLLILSGQAITHYTSSEAMADNSIRTIHQT